MKNKIFLLVIHILASYALANCQNFDQQIFKIEISYRGLPDPIATNYFIDNTKLLVYQTLYDNNSDTFVDFNKSTFVKFDRKKIINFLIKTDWNNIPNKLITPVIDGSCYEVDLLLDNNSFHFDIANTYHPAFDSLFSICNNLIPSKRIKKKYFLPYPN